MMYRFGTRHTDRARTGRSSIAPFVAVLVLGASVGGLFSLGPAAAQAPQTSTRSVPAVTSPCAADVGNESGWVNCMLGQMTVAQKVGQMFVVNGYGTTATDTTPTDVAANQQLYGPGVSTISDLIDTYHPGGIVYFGWSNGLTDPTTVAQLSNGIQQAAASQPLAVPTLISTDQEEGVVTRIGSPATVFPGNMAVGGYREHQPGVPGGGCHWPGAAGDGHQRRQRSGGRRQHQPPQHRRRAPLLRRPAVGGVGVRHRRG